MRFGMDFFIHQWIKHDLGDAFPIPEIHENYPAVISSPMNPAHQHHFLVNVSSTKLPAMMCSAHVT
jgi:hypothetical protein